MSQEENQIEAVRRYFDRKHRGKPKMFVLEATKTSGDRIDLLFIQGRKDCIHLIEAEPSIDRVWDSAHGFDQLGRHKGNYRWLAIPKDVYKIDRREIRKESRRKGIGLLMVSGRERFTVKEKLKKYKEGTFLHLYPEAYEKWKSK